MSQGLQEIINLLVSLGHRGGDGLDTSLFPAWSIKKELYRAMHGELPDMRFNERMKSIRGRRSGPS